MPWLLLGVQAQKPRWADLASSCWGLLPATEHPLPPREQLTDGSLEAHGQCSPQGQRWGPGLVLDALGMWGKKKTTLTANVMSDPMSGRVSEAWQMLGGEASPDSSGEAAADPPSSEERCPP